MHDFILPIGDQILNLLLAIIMFGGMNIFEAAQAKKEICPSYCAVDHFHQFDKVDNPNGLNASSTPLKSK
tara:strand:- start:106 stop:315 length:210 start_codon:yes stop_codon:yes gene_type:complete